MTTISGSGLEGGVNEGEAALALMTCSGGELLQYDMAAGWQCSSYSPGPGLVLVSNAFGLADGNHDSVLIGRAVGQGPVLDYRYSTLGSVFAIAHWGDPASLTIKQGGNVGLGTTSPGQKLDIVGGNGRVETGYSWLTNSDRRLKKNIVTLEDSLAKVSRLRAVRYDALEDAEQNRLKPRHLGVVAQELEVEFPELVFSDEKGTKSVAYDKLSVVAVQAVHDLKEQKDQLAAQVVTLEGRLARVEEALASSRRGEQPATGLPPWAALGILGVGAGVLVARRRRGPHA
ncbi:MAG: tail fiber domain-containing protein [Deltaproteobacteria bacterium]|nr:tail fiber domain-containing protein [Deltaproteobacteria bacterium]